MFTFSYGLFVLYFWQTLKDWVFPSVLQEEFDPDIAAPSIV